MVMMRPRGVIGIEVVADPDLRVGIKRYSLRISLFTFFCCCCFCNGCEVKFRAFLYLFSGCGEGAGRTVGIGYIDKGMRCSDGVCMGRGGGPMTLPKYCYVIQKFLP